MHVELKEYDISSIDLSRAKSIKRISKPESTFILNPGEDIDLSKILDKRKEINARETTRINRK